MRAAMRSMVGALILVAAGCGATIRSTTASNANLSKYRTYAFDTSSRSRGRPESIADQTINSSLRQGLAEKGIVEASAGQPPDFIVAHHVKKQQRVDVDAMGYGYGYGFYNSPGGVDVDQYTEGTLIVDFIDPQTRQVFWRGTASAVLNHPDSPDPGKLATTVGQIVDRYPAMVASVPRTTM